MFRVDGMCSDVRHRNDQGREVVLDPIRKRELRAAVADRFGEQCAATRALAAIPSLRGAEGPALDFVADLLRRRGLVVDDWTVPVAALAQLPGAAPLETGEAVRSVVASHRPNGGDGRSLILQGHVDVVPPGPLSRWSTPPFAPVEADGWMYGRGTADMKSGLVAAIFALDALAAIGLEPAGRVHLQAVVEEESTGLGALATLARGYRADACFIPEPTGERLNRSQVGALWFRLRVHGKPTHVADAGAGGNAILAAQPLITVLQELEDDWNARAADHPHFHSLARPIVFNPGMIRGGDWPSSVPAWCEVDCRIAVLPGWDVAACRAEIERRVAAAAHPMLADRPPELVWNGFLAEGYSFEGHREIEDLLARAHREAVGDGLGERLMTALTDTRAYGLYYAIPAFTYGPVGEAIHGFDERVELASLARVTETIALFVAGWCGARPRWG